MGVYLRAKFQVPCIILTSFKQGGYFYPLLRIPKNPIQIRAKSDVKKHMSTYIHATSFILG